MVTDPSRYLYTMSIDSCSVSLSLSCLDLLRLLLQDKTTKREEKTNGIEKFGRFIYIKNIFQYYCYIPNCCTRLAAAFSIALSKSCLSAQRTNEMRTKEISHFA